MLNEKGPDHFIHWPSFIATNDFYFENMFANWQAFDGHIKNKIIMYIRRSGMRQKQMPGHDGRALMNLIPNCLTAIQAIN